MLTATLVIPCYNEATRLDLAEIDTLMGAEGLQLVLVDDGSTDLTGRLLAEVACRHPGRIDVLTIAVNGGKGEAVRHGLRAALAQPVDAVGFADADFATPAIELLRLRDILGRTPHLEAVLGSRLLRLGSDIERSAARHYLGRVFATMATWILGMPVYDTQCGAKFFRRSEALRTALDEPFVSRWAFDIELIGRLCAGAPRVSGLGVATFLEVPLDTWIAMAGSKLDFREQCRTLLELPLVWRSLVRRRRRIRAAP